jgi:hypothetical protein
VDDSRCLDDLFDGLEVGNFSAIGTYILKIIEERLKSMVFSVCTLTICRNTENLSNLGDRQDDILVLNPKIKKNITIIISEGTDSTIKLENKTRTDLIVYFV